MQKVTDQKQPNFYVAFVDALQLQLLRLIGYEAYFHTFALNGKVLDLELICPEITK